MGELIAPLAARSLPMIGAGLFLLGLAGPLNADDGDEESIADFGSMTEEELVSLLQSSDGRWVDEPCTFGEPLANALLAKTKGAARTKRLQLYASALCANEQERYLDGAKHVAEIQRQFPDTNVFTFALYFAERNEDADAALSNLRSLERDGFDDLELRQLHRTVRIINLAGQADEFEDLALKWSEEGAFAFIDGDLHSSIAISALAAAARSGRHERVDTLLSHITSPAAYIPLLVEREYEPLWAQIERRAGPNLTNVGGESVEITSRRLSLAPIDRDRFSAAARALHFDGQFEAAIALAKKWTKREERGLSIEEGDGWALNIQAYAFDSLGEIEKADAVFDRLAELDPDEHPWVVNFVINRSSRLVGQGRWEEGLKAAGLARSVAEEYGSIYAKMIVARDHACALTKIGKTDEIGPEISFLLENSSESPDLAARGLMCVGRNEEAAAILIDALQDSALRPLALSAFEVEELDLFYTQSMLPNARSLLRRSPKLAVELERHVRKLPEEFIPQAALKRKKLTLPSWD